MHFGLKLRLRGPEVPPSGSFQPPRLLCPFACPKPKPKQRNRATGGVGRAPSFRRRVEPNCILDTQMIVVPRNEWRNRKLHPAKRTPQKPHKNYQGTPHSLAATFGKPRHSPNLLPYLHPFKSESYDFDVLKPTMTCQVYTLRSISSGS